MFSVLSHSKTHTVNDVQGSKKSHVHIFIPRKLVLLVAINAELY